MSEKKLTKPEIMFHKKFLQVLETQNAKFWMKNLGIQYNLLWGWKKGNFPGLPYALEICRISGVSANWLFLDIGPQYIEELDETDSRLSDNEREYLQNLIWDLERRLKKEHAEYEKQIEQLNTNVKRIKAVKWFHDLFDVQEKQTGNLPVKDLVAGVIFPLLDFLGKNADDVTDGLEKFLASKNGKQMANNMTSWINKKK